MLVFVLVEERAGIPRELARDLAGMGRDTDLPDESPSLRRVLVAAFCCVLVALAILTPLLSSLDELPVHEVRVTVTGDSVEVELPRDLAASHPSIEVLDILRGEKIVPARPVRFTTTTRKLLARLEGLPPGRSYRIAVRHSEGTRSLGPFPVSIPARPAP